MVEYVYALHDFSPEHDDEIAFKAGERIEVIEKDDQYGDGWWQGRNLAGKEGLFPQGYTSTASSAPLPEVRTPTVATSSSLQPLQEEKEGPEESTTSSNDGAVMAATLTDVQEAIEQLGVRGDQDAARSFSFSSTRDGETDKETETEDETEADGQGWHKDARKALAERAKKENARKELEEAAENGYTPQRQSVAPPIAVEMSDESDADEDEEVLRRSHRDVHPHHHKYTNSASTAREISLNDTPPAQPLQPAISLVSDNINGSSPSPPPQPQEVTVVSSPALAQPAPQTPTTATAPRFEQPSSPPAALTPSIPFPANVPLPKSPSPVDAAIMSSTPILMSVSQHPTTPPQPTVPMVVPAPAPTPIPASVPVQAPTSPSAPAPTSAQSPGDSVRETLKRSHPSEWTVEQVVEWLRTKNIDEPTCAKFIEHEITGDVLLELDVSNLKELDITAFGKRMRISNAIVELRRPASFSSEAHAGSGFASAGFNMNGFASPAIGAGVFSTESSPHTGDTPASPFSHGRTNSSATSGDPSITGLGIVTAQKARPAQLALSSPSDGALQPKALSAHEDLIPEEGGDDSTQDGRAVQSETEAPPSSTRRRFLGRSTESGSSKEKDTSSRHSKDSPLSSPMPEEVGLRHHARAKRSIDATGSAKGAGDRLSFFSSTLGKARKPPPRYSLYESDSSPPQQAAPDRTSRSISRLYLGHGKKTPRPMTPGKKEKEKEKEKHVEDTRGKNGHVSPDAPTRDTALLRKRHLSTTSPVADNVRTSTVTPGTKVTLHPGQSVLDQIGVPDHAGWLRKKGERYNTWKLRYMVLKGPHLYYLRSNSRSETKIKGYIKVQGYKVIADENANPGKYGFRIIHDVEQAHYFSSEEQMVVREWMKALMKATIDRDYSKPVVSSCNIPTIPLTVAQAMSPTPRPPSPSARAATQKALRRENPNQLSSRDARVLMGLPSPENGNGPQTNGNGDRARLESFFSSESKPHDVPLASPGPPIRPSREMRRYESGDRDLSSEVELVSWANSVLPAQYRISDISTDLTSGLVLLRLAECIKGKPSEPPVPDSVFTAEDNLEGMFKLFDFLLDHDVKMGSVSINDVKHGRPDKTVQLLKSLRAWGERREAVARSIGKGASQAGPWMAVEPAPANNW